MALLLFLQKHVCFSVLDYSPAVCSIPAVVSNQPPEPSIVYLLAEDVAVDGVRLTAICREWYVLLRLKTVESISRCCVAIVLIG